MCSLAQTFYLLERYVQAKSSKDQIKNEGVVMLHCLAKDSHGELTMLPWKSQKSEGANAFSDSPQICQIKWREQQSSRASS